MSKFLTNILFSRWSRGSFAHRRNWFARAAGVNPCRIRSSEFLPVYNYKDQVGGNIDAIRQEIKRADEAMRHSMGCGLNWAIDNTPPEVGINFSSHGIIGGVIQGERRIFEFPVGYSFDNGSWNTYVDPLAALGQVLLKGIDNSKGINQVPFRGSEGASGALGAATPYIDGGIILVSAFNKSLDRGVQYVVLGAQYNRCIDWLRSRFPNATFVPWHEAPIVLTKAANKERQSNIPYVKLTRLNHPPVDFFSRSRR